MISKKRLNQILEEMTEISKRDFLLFSSRGERIAGESPGEFEEQVCAFVDSSEETAVSDQWIYYRLELNGQTEYVLLCSVNEQEDQSYMVGEMALSQIRNLLLAAREPENRTNVLRQILNNEMEAEQVSGACRQLKLRPRNYLLFVIQYKSDRDPILKETLENLFSNRTTDLVVEMDDFRTVLIKDTEDIADGDFEQYARTIIDNLQTEAMTNVWVGYADPIDAFEQMAGAYRDACTALKVGIVFYAEDKIYYYNRLGIARLIYKLPKDLCEMFLQEVLGDDMKIHLDEEMLTTVKKLFENNLNISETARQLYVHRNTLVYRLERIEKSIGLDVRSFRDAMLLSIAMMVRTHVNELNVVN